mmetsp:Transcript_25187/g.70446  ORF Transcript_25187/g.70446 Transcript_25187/m.70446 type:complete len:251 (+) Transcript_25187:775-1527(+)
MRSRMMSTASAGAPFCARSRRPAPRAWPWAQGSAWMPGTLEGPAPTPRLAARQRHPAVQHTARQGLPLEEGPQQTWRRTGRTCLEPWVEQAEQAGGPGDALLRRPLSRACSPHAPACPPTSPLLPRPHRALTTSLHRWAPPGIATPALTRTPFSDRKPPSGQPLLVRTGCQLCMPTQRDLQTKQQPRRRVGSPVEEGAVRCTRPFACSVLLLPLPLLPPPTLVAGHSTTTGLEFPCSPTCHFVSSHDGNM